MNLEKFYKCNIIKTVKKSVTPTNILSELFLKDYKISDIIKCYSENNNIVIDITSTNNQIISHISELNLNEYEINSQEDVLNIIENSPDFSGEAYAKLLFNYIIK